MSTPTTPNDKDRALAQQINGQCLIIGPYNEYEAFHMDKCAQLIAQHREDAVRELEVDKADLDWLEKYLMSLSNLTAPDMGGLRYVGQARNPAKERGEAGPSFIRVQGPTIRAAIRAARKTESP